jgi:hypothetical protein
MNTPKNSQINPDSDYPLSGQVLGDGDFCFSFWFLIICILFAISLLVFLGITRNKKRKLLKELSLLSRQNSELRLRSLQMQMNPHFIFNSLTSLQDLILSQKTREALIYLGLWAGVIRTNLENVLEEYIKLSDEIIFLEKYTEMGKARFKGKLNIYFSKRLPDTGIMIPPMIIQPVIENAIKHGVGGNDLGGNICGSWLACSKDSICYTHIKLLISENDFEFWEQNTFNHEEPEWTNHSILSGKFFLRDYREDKLSEIKYYRMIFFPNGNASQERINKGIELSNMIILVEGLGLYIVDQGVMKKKAIP